MDNEGLPKWIVVGLIMQQKCPFLFKIVHILTITIYFDCRLAFMRLYKRKILILYDYTAMTRSFAKTTKIIQKPSDFESFL